MKNKLTNIQKKEDKLEKERKYLRDKIHLYFDSKIDTRDSESYIINYFWQNATYSSDFYTSVLKQNYTKLSLSKIIKKYCTNFDSAIDIGCGNGIYTEHLATLFNSCVGLDLSKKRIQKNIKKNKVDNIKYLSENFITCKSDTLGKFDFIFASDLGMYSDKKHHKKIFYALLGLLNKNGVLLTRESTRNNGHIENKSYNYIAYYNNKDYYKKGIYKKCFVKSYRDCSYNIPNLNKYFAVFPNKKEVLNNNPLKLNKIVKKYISEDTGSSHYYVYKDER